MAGTWSRWWVTGALGVALALPAAANAGHPYALVELPGGQYPVTPYSPFHYWTPQLYRLWLRHHDPAVTVPVYDRYQPISLLPGGPPPGKETQPAQPDTRPAEPAAQSAEPAAEPAAPAPRPAGPSGRITLRPRD